MLLSVGPLLLLLACLPSVVGFLPFGLDLLVAGVLLGLGGVLVLGILQGRRDYKQYCRVAALQSDPTPANAAEAFQHINSPQAIVRTTAIETVRAVCEYTPGKLTTRLGARLDAEAISESLVQRLRDEETDVRWSAATIIKLLSRDYPSAFYPHAPRFSTLLEHPDSHVRIEMALTLGYLGSASTDTASSAAGALVPAVQDADPDVRRAATASLGRLPCPRSITMLDHLTADAMPAVQQDAQRALDSVRSRYPPADHVAR
ncbi:HEAT repeat domain-containing protein [Halobium palmae]|uniref:HEAT repeat domain-containing protein n=1 Tax=Halobium palmae TaxID=1776492 RepID=A0ABD5RWI5_9EURY